jgi:DNA-binding FadR family transcriptional regulator
MAQTRLSSHFLDYLASTPNGEPQEARLPALNDLSKKLGISVSTLREQMEGARTLGLVEARPRTGIRRLQYSFLPAVRQSLSYAIAIDPKQFQAFADLRQHIEAAYWREAVSCLTPADLESLRALMQRAWAKLHGTPIQIPQDEHRELHLSIYRRLNNPFVLGLLEAYWEAYEAVGLNVYADYQYLTEVWNFHQSMVEAICEGDFEAGYTALVEHTDLIYHRPAQSQDGGPISTKEL